MPNANRWPRDNQADLIRFYGTPGPQVEAQLVPVIPPFQMFYDGKPVKQIRFHKKAAPALKAALDEIWKHYGRDQRAIDKLGISVYSGAYNPRFIRGSTTKWSNHAYGAAIDINAEHNGFGTGHGNMPQPVIDAFKRQGARWGGDYSHRSDPMHFEFCDAGQTTAVSFADLPQEEPQADGDSDSTAVDTANTDAKPSFFSKWKKHITSGVGSIGGLSFLGYMTTWQVVVVLCVFTFIAIASAIGFFIWFMGAERVRAWLRRQISPNNGDH